MTDRVYGTSPVKRVRRTKNQVADLDTAIYNAVKDEHPVTLRGVFYRVVSAGAIDKSEAGYRAIARRLLVLRREGVVPYSWITDGSRLRMKPDSWNSVDDLLDEAARTYRRALWNDQDVEVIIISEKDAISGVISPVTFRWDVELAVTRGYSSETFVHSIAQTVIDNHNIGKTTFIYQLGDHDPSGADAWRDFIDKTKSFAKGAAVEFERIAVTPEQIIKFGLPTRPTKKTDTRAASFHGQSVEVDALPPRILRQLVEDAIVQHIDQHQLDITLMAEASERDVLYRMKGIR